MNSASATFAFSSSKPSPTFKCSLDGATFSTCTSPKQYTGISNGKHTFRVQVISGGNTVGTEGRTWVVDTKAPVAKAPTSNVIPNISFAHYPTSVPTKVVLSGSDVGGTGVVSYQLQLSVNGGAFSSGAYLAPGTNSNRWLEVGNTYQYRVQTADAAGNRSSWKLGPKFTVDLREEHDTAVTYTGTWTRVEDPYASGGYRKYSAAAGAKASFSFTGSSVAWVAPKGPGHGMAEVWVDGAKAATVDLYAPSEEPQAAVFSKSWASSGTHTVEVRVLGTKNAASSGKRVSVDAFVALR